MYSIEGLFYVRLIYYHEDSKTAVEAHQYILDTNFLLGTVLLQFKHFTGTLYGQAYGMERREIATMAISFK